MNLNITDVFYNPCNLNGDGTGHSSEGTLWGEGISAPPKWVERISPSGNGYGLPQKLLYHEHGDRNVRYRPRR